MGRTDALFAQGLELIKKGGNIDLTAGDGEAAQRIFEAEKQGIDLESITVSSDGYGSQPRFDAGGNCIGLGWTGTGVLMEELQALVESGMRWRTRSSSLPGMPPTVWGFQQARDRSCRGWMPTWWFWRITGRCLAYLQVAISCVGMADN